MGSNFQYAHVAQKHAIASIIRFSENWAMRPIPAETRL
jgi:hypothetical protein